MLRRTADDLAYYEAEAIHVRAETRRIWDEVRRSEERRFLDWFDRFLCELYAAGDDLRVEL